MANDDAIRTLIYLIEINEEAADGFHKLAGGVEQNEFQVLFRLYSRQRMSFANALKWQVAQLGGDMESETVQSMMQHARSKLHRARIDLRRRISGGSRHAMLSEAERGDDAAVRAYEEAMRSGLPAEVMHQVRDQYNAIHEAHRRLLEMRDTTAGE